MTKEELIEELARGGYLKSRWVTDAFKKIDRKDFVPEEYQDEAYGNYPLPIGFGQTISQPLTVAVMLELLQPKSGEKILEIGAGSGWQAALLAYAIGKKSGISNDQFSISKRKESSGMVVAIERIPQLAKTAERNIAKYGFIETGAAKVIPGDGSKGYPADAPYDKIVAAAGEKIPDEWKKQLEVGGRIVAPIGQSIVVLDKISEKEFREKEYFGFSFVPLIKD